MSRWKALLKAAGISLGGVGVVACVVVVVVLWMLSIRVGTAIESLFRRVDQSFITVDEWGGQVKERFAAAAITSGELEKALQNWTQNWTTRQASERLAIRLDAVQKTERLASGLRQADQWLEMSASSVGLVQQILSTGASPADTTSIDELLAEIESMRTQLAEATEFVGRIQDRISDAGEANSPEAPVEAALRFALRVAATLHSFGSRLEKLADRVSAAQNRLHELNVRVQRCRLYLTAGIMALMVWMAVGQVALFRQARSVGSGN